MRWSPLIVTMSALLLVVLVACGGESKATPSPTTASAPSPTPSPTVTLVSIPSPTATAARKLSINPAGFLQALPASERECMEQAVELDRLEEIIASEEPEDEPAQETLRACLSEETSRFITQEACVVEAIGEQASRELFSGQGQPSTDELDVLRSCGIIEPSLAQRFDMLPEASAPAGLSAVVWPVNVQESSALFQRLPSGIAGHGNRTRFERRGPVFITEYGEDPETHEPVMWATVQDLTEGGFFPSDTNAGQFVALYATSSDWEVLAAGREGNFAWVQWQEGGIYVMSWGNAPSSVVFGAIAKDLRELMVLVEAMVSAAGG